LYHAALAVAGLTILALYTVILLSRLAGAPPLVAIACSLLTGGAVVAVAVRRSPGLAGIWRARARFHIAAVLVGAGHWFPALLVVEWIIPVSEHRESAEAIRTGAWLPAFCVIVVLPAIVEELVFRGVLARALAGRHGVAVGVVASAIVFSAYHMSLGQAVPTLLLGLELGFIAVRANSAVPTMVAHAMNNAIVLWLTRDREAIAWCGDHAVLLGIACTTSVALGIAVAATGRRSTQAASVW
jgi:membrane protease YdiL (CAAX protease family)